MPASTSPIHEVFFEGRFATKTREVRRDADTKPAPSLPPISSHYTPSGQGCPWKRSQASVKANLAGYKFLSHIQHLTQHSATRLPAFGCRMGEGGATHSPTVLYCVLGTPRSTGARKREHVSRGASRCPPGARHDPSTSRSSAYSN